MALLAIPIVAVSCATQPPEADEPAFATEPVAPSPRLEIRWRESVDTAVAWAYRDRQYAAPALLRTADRRELLVGTDSGWLYRYRASDAKMRWRRDLGGPIHATPAPTDDRIFVGTLHGTLYALDRKTGETDWKIENDREIESQPAVADGLVFYTTNAGRLVAADVTSGEVAWEYSRSTPKEFTIKGSGTPVVHGHTVYCGFADGVVAALDTRSGAQRWLADVTGGKTEYTDVDGPVFVRDDRVYVASYGSGVAALDRNTGSAVWSHPFENIAAAVMAERSIYITLATGRVVGLDAETGESKWGFRMANNLPVDISQAGSYLFVSTGNGPMYVLDRATGYPMLKWNPSSGVNAPVTFSETAGYMLSNKGYLYSFQVAY